jgi:hypothetical protein
VRAPHRRSHPRQKFPRTEGLGHVVMRAQLQQQHLVHHFRFALRMMIGNEGAAWLISRHTSCPGVPANSSPAPARTAPPPETSPDPLRRSRNIHRKAFGFKQSLERFLHGAIVLDHQYPLRTGRNRVHRYESSRR